MQLNDKFTKVVKGLGKAKLPRLLAASPVVFAASPLEHGLKPLKPPATQATHLLVGAGSVVVTEVDATGN